MLLAAGHDVTDSAVIAAHAANTCKQLSKHVSRLVGDLGMRVLFERSLYLAGASVTCLRDVKSIKLEGPCEALRGCLQAEAPDVALAAAGHVFVTFIELLERFIGEALVASLLQEVWPESFAAVKETK